MLQRPQLRKLYKSYVHQAAVAVAFLHQHGIVHGNLKVENYLLANDLTVGGSCVYIVLYYWMFSDQTYVVIMQCFLTILIRSN